MSTPKEIASRPRKTARRQRAPECWACGVPAPKPSHIASAGWHVRDLVIEHHKFRECYCPDCFARWGWPEETGLPK